jgi:hypothetical protein
MDKKTIFADGIIFQDPHEKAPQFIKFELVINPQKFVEFMRANMEYTTPKGWMKIVAKESKKGGIYFELDTWKPTPKPEAPQTSMTSTQPDGSDPIDTEAIPF